MEPIAHKEQFTIRTYEIDNKKKATLPALVKLMHEAAMQNVLRLKLSVWDLEPHQISWVLMRKKIILERLPDLGEEITIETYPAGFEKFFTYRDYKVYDSKGDRIAYASSTWLLMDTVKRRMTRIPQFILDIRDRFQGVENWLERPDGKLPKFVTSDQQKEYLVNWHDLDFNMHLNNTFYVQWMLECLPDEVLKNGKLKSFDITYRQEATWKEKIISEIQQLEDKQFLHRLIRASDEKELAAALTQWE